MTPREEVAAVRIGQRILGPVGDWSRERLDWGASAGVHVVHVRRPVTDAELRVLPGWFLACPAIDLAGMNPLKLKLRP